jgi:hypothetical protein
MKRIKITSHIIAFLKMQTRICGRLIFHLILKLVRWSCLIKIFLVIFLSADLLVAVYIAIYKKSKVMIIDSMAVLNKS